MNKSHAARPLAELIRPVLAETLKAQGFATSDILALWPDIVGDRLAEHCAPVRLLWPPRPRTESPSKGPEPATLILRVEGVFAWEIEMAAAQIIERINGVFGWRCVGKLKLYQAPVEILAKKPLPKPRHLQADRDQTLADALSVIKNEGLRSSLQKLGRSVLAARFEPDR